MHCLLSYMKNIIVMFVLAVIEDKICTIPEFFERPRAQACTKYMYFIYDPTIGITTSVFHLFCDFTISLLLGSYRANRSEVFK